MISYQPFYKTLKNKNISTVTLDGLCKILSCRVEDVIIFVEESQEEQG